jgi:hypothetical protein
LDQARRGTILPIGSLDSGQVSRHAIASGVAGQKESFFVARWGVLVALASGSWRNIPISLIDRSKRVMA